MNREEGYYHVQYPSGVWDILFWDADCKEWMLPNKLGGIYDSDLKIVGDRIPYLDENTGI